MTADEILYSPLINEARDVLADLRDEQNKLPLPLTLTEFNEVHRKAAILISKLKNIYAKMSEREYSDMELVHTQHCQLSVPWGSS